MFMNLSNEQRLKMYEHVAMYLDSHYESVIDAGLTDDILLAEYKAGLASISDTNLDEEERQKQIDWLSILVWQMIECSVNNLAEGRKNLVYANFIKTISELF